jgi:hypothetical protein
MLPPRSRCMPAYMWLRSMRGKHRMSPMHDHACMASCMARLHIAPARRTFTPHLYVKPARHTCTPHLNPWAVADRPVALCCRKVMRSLPTWALHLGSQKLFDGDSVFLHGQGRLLQAAKPQGAQGQQGSSPQQAAWASTYFMPMSCDRAVVAARKWIDKVGGGGPSYAAEAAPEVHQVPPIPAVGRCFCALHVQAQVLRSDSTVKTIILR